VEKKRKVRRKTFAARQDLIESASKLAKQKGYSLYAFFNEMLQLTFEAEELGVSFRTLLDERGLLKAAKEASFILGLENLWYDMADIAYEKAKRKSLNSWVEAGIWLAKSYISSGTNDPFSAFKRDLEAFTWNASEFDFKEEKSNVSIRIISPRFSESYTFLFAAFLESALKTFGYTRFNKDVSRGTIRLKAHRKKN
jgi:hypothetical protein